MCTLAYFRSYVKRWLPGISYLPLGRVVFLGNGFPDELLGSIRIRNGVLRLWRLEFTLFVLRALDISELELLSRHLKALLLKNIVVAMHLLAALLQRNQLLNRLGVDLLQRHDHAGATRA